MIPKLVGQSSEQKRDFENQGQRSTEIKNISTKIFSVYTTSRREILRGRLSLSTGSTFFLALKVIGVS
jgi:hypothetical protein